MTTRFASRIERLQLPERGELIGKSVGASEREVLEWPSPDAEVLNLTCADTHSHPAPDWVPGAFAEGAAGAIPSYTAFRGHQPVLEAVAEHLGAFLGIDIDPTAELLLSAGSQGGLFAVMAALVEPGDRVALLDPDYLSTERTLRFLGADVVHVPLAWQSPTPDIDLDALRDALRDGARLFIFSHPNNPTGSVLPPSTIAAVAELLREYDAYAVVDQLYSRLVYDGRPYTHLAALPGMKDRCITSMGPSKAESMTGYRIGALVLPRSISDAVEDVQAITSIRAPAYSQYVLKGWLHDDMDFMDRRREAYRELRDQTVAALSGLPDVHVQASGGTSYLFVDVSDMGRPDQEVAKHLLRDAHVVVNPGYQFGPRGVGKFRICFAQDPSIWGSYLERMAGALRSLAAG